MGWTEPQSKVESQGQESKVGEPGFLERENSTDATGTSSIERRPMGLTL